MQKTFAALLVALAVSVMGVPMAYLVGQRSAEHDVQRRLLEERARARAERQELIAGLSAGLPQPASVPQVVDPTTALPNLPDQTPDPAAGAVEMPSIAPEIRVEPTSAAAVAEAPAPIARAIFDGLLMGESYADAAQKLGREGLPALTMRDASGSETRQYVWTWASPEGAPARITLRFVDGALIAKEFSGDSGPR